MLRASGYRSDNPLRMEHPTAQGSDDRSRRRFLLASSQSLLSGCWAVHTAGAATSDERPSLPRWDSHPAEGQSLYQRNVAKFGGKLATDPKRLLQPQVRTAHWQFDILILGGGLSAAHTAARLASRLRPGVRLGLLEKGSEGVPKGLKVQGEDASFAMKQWRGMGSRTILQGCGLGGSSLLFPTQGVVPHAEVMRDEAWPESLTHGERMRRYFDEIVAILELQKSHVGWDATEERVNAALLAGLGQEGLYDAPFPASVAKKLGSSQLPILNRQGWLLAPCTACGDCLQGCTLGAINSAQCNRFPVAVERGVEVFTQTTVHSIEKIVDHYRVHFTHHVVDGSGTLRSTPGSTTAKIVVVAAGAVDSAEILLRSQSPHFRLSTQVGKRWNGNGVVLGVARSRRANASDRATATTLATPRIGEVTSRPWRDRIQVLRSLKLDECEGELWMAMGHDPARGTFWLDEAGQLRLDWDGGENLYRQRAKAELRRWGAALGYTLEFPGVLEPLQLQSLGGCCMAEDPSSGAVNERGELFDMAFGGDMDPVTGTYRVHAGCYVLGSATVPTTLGCPPHCLVASLALHTADQVMSAPQNQSFFA